MNPKTDWRKLLANDGNFDQKTEYDINGIKNRLQFACSDLKHLNPFCVLSAIYEYTKFFAKISSGLSMGFSDITKKVQQMREKFLEYPEATDIQDLLNTEIKLGIHQLNGDNNSDLGHGKDQYKKYCSASRTFLRLMWFLEYLIRIFDKVLNDDGKGEVKKILGDSYDEVLAPRHKWIVRKAVGVALALGGGGDINNFVNIIFSTPKLNEEAKGKILEIVGLMKVIWEECNSFYKEKNMLDLK